MALVTISPAILSKTPSEYKRTVNEYYPFAKRVHVDVSDGTLTPNKTIAEDAVWWPRGWQTDIHMITDTPSTHIEMLLKIHPNMVIFHAEAKEDLLPIFKNLKDNGIKVGVAIVRSVYPGSIKAILNAADHALIFSGELGKYGGTADLLLGEKVALIQDIHRDIEIGWDGGVNIENVRALSHSDINILNVGSAMKTDDPKTTWEDLMKEREARGVRI